MEARLKQILTTSLADTNTSMSSTVNCVCDNYIYTLRMHELKVNADNPKQTLAELKTKVHQELPMCNCYFYKS